MNSYKDYVIKRVNSKELHNMILNYHYAQRLPSITFAFGLFYKNKLIGGLTVGKPASNSLCEGICGREYKSKVYELNRLILIQGNFIDNILSYFVGSVLKQMKKENIILVSYADSGMNHNGYIYQATNFLYTGKTKERTDKYMPNNKHSRHYTEEYKHLRKIRYSKYRYVYFCANKKIKKEYLTKLKYPILSYPKSENKTYILGEKQKIKIYNKITKEYFYE